MTENLDWFSQVDAAEDSAQATPSPQIVTLQLPPDVALALHQHCQQLGQPQSEAIVTLLRSAMQLASTPSPQTSSQADADPVTTQEVNSLKARLSQLEQLIPRLEALEGKWVAF